MGHAVRYIFKITFARIWRSSCQTCLRWNKCLVTQSAVYFRFSGKVQCVNYLEMHIFISTHIHIIHIPNTYTLIQIFQIYMHTCYNKHEHILMYSLSIWNTIIFLQNLGIRTFNTYNIRTNTCFVFVTHS